MTLTQEDKDWAAGVAAKIREKEEKVAERNLGKIPYTAKDHVFDDRSGKNDISWWTNGFWGGMMWQLYKATGHEIFKKNAVFTEETMDAVLMNYNGMDHDAGFRWLPTSVARCRFSDTKEPASINRALLAATNLAGRFNGGGNFIRAWNDWGDDRDTTGWAIIDCMMNLPLLYWASDVTKDPRFAQVAISHADTAARSFIREDGSVRHIVGFDPYTGKVDKDYGGQGYGEGSSWTRGQTWALYGFGMSYLHTGKPEYLEIAKKVADTFVSKIPENGLIPVDFDQPADCTWQDSTAGAIAACGLLHLALLLEGSLPSKPVCGSPYYAGPRGPRAAKDPASATVISERAPFTPDPAAARCYQDAALKLLKALDAENCDYDPAHDELLEKCTAAYHDREHEFPIIYGDYYFIEAIWKLTGEELYIW